MDAIRKRNAELTKKIDDMKFELEFNSQLNMNSHQRAKSLIDDLEKIKQEWELVLDDLNDKREKYYNLITDLQVIKNVMVDKGFRIPWHRKITNKLKRL